MSATIHSMACVSSKAKLAEGVIVGPFAVIDDNVVIGKNTIIDNGVRITGRTTIGEGCHIFNGASVGTDPQDLKYAGEDTELFIGNNNKIREFCTINKGTVTGSGKTIIGNNNLFMAYCHVAHDCIIGNDNVFANCATLAGHVEVQDHVVVGGITAAHQFVRIGSHVMIGGFSVLRQDVLPYALVEGVPAATRGINIVGLRRRNFSQESISALKKAIKILCHSELAVSSAVEKIKNEIEMCPDVEAVLKFVSGSERGFIK